MKRLDSSLEDALLHIPSAMQRDGYRRLSPAVLEKDVLVTEIISAVVSATLSDGEYRLVFCGGTCLSKAYSNSLERMSEDVDFKIAHANNFEGMSKSQVRRDMSELKGRAAQILEQLGYSSDDLHIRARDDNRYIMIEAHYKSLFDRATTLREPIQLELNTSKLQMAPQMRPIGRIIDHWLHSSAIPPLGQVDCIDPIEAVAEKLIAFPRRYAHHERGLTRGETRPFDSTLVRHLYDVCRMSEYMRDLGHEKVVHKLRPMMRRLILKDARDFQHQHPEFVDDAHGEIATFMERVDSSSMRANYENFVEAMVYAPDQRRPSFDKALGAFTGLLSQVIYGPSPDIRGQLAKEQEALTTKNQRADKAAIKKALSLSIQPGRTTLKETTSASMPGSSNKG